MKKLTWRLGGALIALSLYLVLPAPDAQAFKLNGFGDVTFDASERTSSEPDSNGFALGALDFYVAEQISDRLDVLAEFVIESPGDGFVVDLERLQATYSLGNNHKVRAGRFHNLLGYWNLAFHHGAQLHTTISRPFFLEFEDESGVVPTHMIGLWWNSRMNTGMGRVNIGIMVGNGSSIKGDLTGSNAGPAELNPGSSGDSDRDKAISAKLNFEPSFMRGAELGIYGNFSRVNITDTALAVGAPGYLTTVEQFIWGVDVVYLAHNIEFMSEVYNWINDTQGATKESGSVAAYGQLGYLIGERTTPYIRYEYLDATADAYFNAVGMTVGGLDRLKTVTTVGVRYDINYRSALKAEYRAIDDQVDGAVNQGAVQWSFAF